MSKLGRIYRLEIRDKNNELLVFTPPLTMEFTVDRTTLSSANVSSIILRNLSKDSRERLQKDAWVYESYREMKLYVGYETTSLQLVATGNVQQAHSVRAGSDWFTSISCYDGGWAIHNARSNFSITRGTPVNDVVGRLVNDLVDSQGVSRGEIGNFNGTYKRGNTLSGSTLNLLNEVTAGSAFIDNGRINVLRDDEFIPSTIFIDSETGLLETPIRENFFARITTLLEPRINLQMKIRLESEGGVDINGEHIVYSLSHSGTISEVEGGKATSTIGFRNSNIVGGVV